MYSIIIIYNMLKVLRRKIMLIVVKVIVKKRTRLLRIIFIVHTERS